jgi:hypothetical protein
MKQTRETSLVLLAVLVPENSTPLVGQVMRSNYPQEDLLDGNDERATEKSTDRSGGPEHSNNEVQEGTR